MKWRFKAQAGSQWEEVGEERCGTGLLLPAQLGVRPWLSGGLPLHFTGGEAAPAPCRSMAGEQGLCRLTHCRSGAVPIKALRGGVAHGWEGQQEPISGPCRTGQLGFCCPSHDWQPAYIYGTFHTSLQTPKLYALSWKTAKTSERLIVSQVIFSIQIELNGSWKQLYIKLQQIYVLFRPTQANINASVTW